MKYSYQEYLKKTYAAWLGKVIGVRLGSPVENWSSEKIAAEYGNKEGYLVDYDVYASDDDTNGPLFFVRALLEKDEISAEDVGNAFLNYICEYSGFFWWGDPGVSTEHTAYENLKNGIKAPLSGSEKTNGRAIAEQIGGQIFSDCWGYVAGGDPALAARLARMASSVTHDRCGIEGGIFVAVCIALAYERKDVREVIEQALGYLNEDLEYYQIVRKIMNYHDQNPDDWKKCLKYIQENYGYDKYPGVCHIIPNCALMIMAMCYGDNDFTKTLTMLNQSGWDTDCNCGNVGSIMGALVGLEGIDESWIRPINDIVNASSCVGCLNIQTISDSAKLFTDLAFRLQGEKREEVSPFILPYATKGIRCSEGRVFTKDGLLKVESRDIYKYIYYLAKDLYDARYDPQFSPLVYPSDTVTVRVRTEKPQKMRLYMADCEGVIWKSEEQLIESEGRISWQLPSRINLTVNRLGIISEEDYFIVDYEMERHPNLDYDFYQYPIDAYGPRYEGDYMANIRGFVVHSGSWTVDEGLIGESGEHALISSGAFGNKYDQIEWTFVPERGREHYLVINMTGYLHYDAIGLADEGIRLIHKDIEESVEREIPCFWACGRKYAMILKPGSVQVNDETFELPELDRLEDLYGLALGKDCRCQNLSLKIMSKQKES